MPDEYPQNIIWYIEAQSNDGKNATAGSGVAIRLQKPGDSQSAKTYLLTCSHVIRGKSSDDVSSAGPMLDQIYAWAPETAFNKNQRVSVSVTEDIKRFDSLDIPLKERKNGADDWVVLLIDDSQTRDAAPAVENWASGVDTSVRIHGFPAGDKSFVNGIVRSTQMPGPIEFRHMFNGVIHLTGDDSRSGVSGGGVFNYDTGELVGIHRARFDEALQLHAVSANHVRKILEHKGFKVVESPREKNIPLPEGEHEEDEKLNGGRNGFWPPPIKSIAAMFALLGFLLLAFIWIVLVIFPMEGSEFDVLLMDSSYKEYVYNKNTRDVNLSNTRDIRRILSVLEIHDIGVEPVSFGWTYADDIKAKSPDLILLHLSSFAVPKRLNTPTETLEADGFGGLVNFLSVMADTSTEFIIYSRGLPDNEELHKPLRQKLSSGNQSLADRLHFLPLVEEPVGFEDNPLDARINIDRIKGKVRIFRNSHENYQ